MPPHDHRPRRPRPRPDLRLRHDRLRRRAVGPALDHDRHEPRRARARAHAPHGGEVPVLPPRRLAGGRSARKPSSPARRRRLASDRGRHPQGLRLRARAARHAEVDRPEPRHPRGHDPRRDRRRDRPPRRHRDLFDRPYEDRKVVRVAGPVHRREPVAASRHASTAPRTSPQPRPPAPVDAGGFVDDDPRQPPPAGVQNTKQRASASSSTRLDPYPGVCVQATGEYTRGRRAEDASRSPSGPSTAPSARSSSATPPRRPCRLRRPARRLRLRVRPAGEARRRRASAG